MILKFIIVLIVTFLNKYQYINTMKKIINFVITEDNISDYVEKLNKNTIQKKLSGSDRTKNEHFNHLKMHTDAIVNTIVKNLFSKNFSIKNESVNGFYSMIINGLKTKIRNREPFKKQNEVSIQNNSDFTIVNWEYLKDAVFDIIIFNKTYPEYDEHNKIVDIDTDKVKFSIQFKDKDKSEKIYYEILGFITYNDLVNKNEIQENSKQQPYDMIIYDSILRPFNIEELNKLNDNDFNLKEIIKQTNDIILPNQNVRTQNKLNGKRSINLPNYIKVCEEFKKNPMGNKITEEYKILWYNKLIDLYPSFNNGVKIEKIYNPKKGKKLKPTLNTTKILDEYIALDPNKTYKMYIQPNLNIIDIIIDGVKINMKEKIDKTINEMFEDEFKVPEDYVSEQLDTLKFLKDNQNINPNDIYEFKKYEILRIFDGCRDCNRGIRQVKNKVKSDKRQKEEDNELKIKSNKKLYVEIKGENQNQLSSFF